MAQNLTVKKGQCINFGNCSKANAKEMIEIDLGDDFVCPECEGGLIEKHNPPPPPWRWILIITCIVVVLGAGGYFIWNMFTTPPPPPPLPSDSIYHPITPDGIIFDKTSLEFEDTGTSEQLTATVFPTDVPDKNKKVIWQSGDETVATVDSAGVVTAIANGNAVISAYTLNGLSATCYVTVGDVSPDSVPPDSIDVPNVIDITGVTLDKTTLSLEKGKSMQLNNTVYPEDATNKEVSWKSDNETVATVDSTGLVTAIAEGTVHITVTATTNREKMAICTVTVKKEITVPAPPTPDQLNNLLNKIANADDNATDKLRSLLGNNLRVEGAANINNVQQLITDVSNGSRYKVTKVNTDADGKVVSISVSKQL